MKRPGLIVPRPFSFGVAFLWSVDGVGDIATSDVTATGDMLEKVLTAIEWTDSKRSPVGHMG